MRAWMLKCVLGSGFVPLFLWQVVGGVVERNDMRGAAVQSSHSLHQLVPDPRLAHLKSRPLTPLLLLPSALSSGPDRYGLWYAELVHPHVVLGRLLQPLDQDLYLFLGEGYGPVEARARGVTQAYKRPAGCVPRAHPSIAHDSTKLRPRLGSQEGRDVDFKGGALGGARGVAILAMRKHGPHLSDKAGPREH